MFNVKEEAKILEQEIIHWRRELHQIPEIGSDLPKTTLFIRNELDKQKLDYETYSNMGIRVVIDSGHPGPVFALRADMDALPITEETGLPFAATGGCMHACGHDAHVAILLGTLKLLNNNMDEWIGNVIGLFQPAEETTGGAKQMIEEGCFENPKPDIVINLHIGNIFKNVGNGQIGIRKGSMMASVDAFEVNVKGVGGHGGRPHQCVDTLLIACEMVQAIQKIVSREISPLHAAVITVGKIQGSPVPNIIPEQTQFCGTIRVFNPDDRDHIERRLKEMLPLIAQANRATAEINFNRYYPPTVNNSQVVDFLMRTAAKIVGAENVIEIPEASTGTEDFAYYLLEVPGAFGTLGSVCANADGVVYPHHNPRFELDEKVFATGVAVYAQCVIDFCQQKERFA